MKDFLKNLGLLPISKERRSIEDLLITSNSIFDNDSFIVELEERINPRLESFHGKGIVYIPQKFKEIEPIYLKLKEKLGEIQYSAGLESAKSKMISLRESMITQRNNSHTHKLI